VPWQSRQLCFLVLPRLNPLYHPRPLSSKHSRPIVLRRTTGTIAGIATPSIATIIGLLQHDKSATKMGSQAAPHFHPLLCRLGSALEARMFRERLAPRERCAQLFCSSKPGGVMSPPKLSELTPPCYSCAAANASKDCMKTRIPLDRVGRSNQAIYFMKSVSRSWSRLTNAFVVR
jgi:hypothetical protein